LKGGRWLSLGGGYERRVDILLTEESWGAARAYENYDETSYVIGQL
jgi:hypothetical protein